VLLALFLSASLANAFTSLSSVAGNQVQVNHLTPLQQPISDPTNEPSREPICKPTKRLGQDALLPGNLSSTRVLLRVSMMDDEIQSCKTHSEYTQSYQVAIPVPFISFRSKSFGLAYCWVHSHWKTTANLFNAQHSIQFARIKRSFISARVLISTFDGSTSSSRMVCWVCTLTVKVPLLHQTNHAVPSKWWYKQQHYVPLVSCWDLHQSAKAALKAIAEVQASADKTKPNNASSFNDKPSSTFQLVVASVDWISKSISSLDQIKANANLQTMRREAASHFNIGRLYELDGSVFVKQQSANNPNADKK
jgi:hypothetical protein